MASGNPGPDTVTAPETADETAYAEWASRRYDELPDDEKEAFMEEYWQTAGEYWCL